MFAHHLSFSHIFTHSTLTKADLKVAFCWITLCMVQVQYNLICLYFMLCWTHAQRSKQLQLHQLPLYQQWSNSFWTLKNMFIVQSCFRWQHSLVTWGVEEEPLKVAIYDLPWMERQMLVNHSDAFFWKNLVNSSSLDSSSSSSTTASRQGPIYCPMGEE